MTGKWIEKVGARQPVQKTGKKTELSPRKDGEYINLI